MQQFYLVLRNNVSLWTVMFVLLFAQVKVAQAQDKPASKDDNLPAVDELIENLTEDTEDAEDTRLAKAASSAGTFDPEHTAPDAKVTEDAGHKKAAPSAPSARVWRVTRVNGESFTVCRTPPATAAEMIEQYPGATVEPIRGAGA